MFAMSEGFRRSIYWTRSTIPQTKGLSTSSMLENAIACDPIGSLFPTYDIQNPGGCIPSRLSIEAGRFRLEPTMQTSSRVPFALNLLPYADQNGMSWDGIINFASVLEGDCLDSSRLRVSNLL